ncbi:MAG: hypothetical protein WCC25_06080, partial [Candidatus Korobacteraceae bacterium]
AAHRSRKGRHLVCAGGIHAASFLCAKKQTTDHNTPHRGIPGIQLFCIYLYTAEKSVATSSPVSSMPKFTALLRTHNDALHLGRTLE